MFICDLCAGVHRSLGTHISFVQSCTIDKWKPEWIELAKKATPRKWETTYSVKTLK